MNWLISGASLSDDDWRVDPLTALLFDQLDRLLQAVASHLRDQCHMLLLLLLLAAVADGSSTRYASPFRPV
jgi:hypothetical protein